MTGSSGQRYGWRYHDAPEIEYLVTLTRRQEPDASLLALNTYCRPFLMPVSRLGVWCPEPGYLRVLCFDPDLLQSFPLADLAGWFKRSQDRIYSATAPLAEVEVSSKLPAGIQSIEVPAEFRGLEELLMVGPYPARDAGDPACAVIALHPNAGQVTVLPQTWFTSAKYEPGRQWITRVIRDPASQRILGEGFRIGNFELTEDGTAVERWIE